MKIGKIIENERRQKGISQSKLGEILGVSQDTVSIWEKGKGKPTIDSVIALADFFQMSTDELLDRTDPSGVSVLIKKNLSFDEEELILLFRKLNYQNKNQLIGFAKSLAYN